MNRLQEHLHWAASVVVVLVAALLILLTGCSSDDFSPTGSDLPSDVVQDSLLVPLNIVGTVDELSLDMPILDPPQGESIELRDFLYFGTLVDTDWKATPFVRFEFTNPDTLDTQFLRDNPDSLRRIDMLFRMARWDAESGPRLEIGLYELNAPIDPSMAEGPVSSYLGPKLGDYSPFRGKTVTVNLLEGLSSADSLAMKNRVLDWIEAEDHPGLALVDTATDSSLVGLAGVDFDFGRYGYLLSTSESTVNPVVVPRMTISYRAEGEPAKRAEELSISYACFSDLTVFERGAGAGAFALGGHLTGRLWFDFDLSVLPRAATINGADLLLHFDRALLAATGTPGTEVVFDADPNDPDYQDLKDRSDGDRTFIDSTLAPVFKQVLVYESTLAQAEALDTTGMSQVRDALSSFRPDYITSGTQEGDDTLRLNVTDFVQRVVNGLFDGNPPGLLLAATDEEIEFYEAVFFDSSAVDSLRPRLEIRYTPPADFAP